jgi:hypothetical protein
MKTPQLKNHLKKKTLKNIFIKYERGSNFLRCTKILSQCHPFLSFLPNFLLPCKDTFMDDYDKILNCNDIKYNPFENFDNF